MENAIIPEQSAFPGLLRLEHHYVLKAAKLSIEKPRKIDL